MMTKSQNFFKQSQHIPHLHHKVFAKDFFFNQNVPKVKSVDQCTLIISLASNLSITVPTEMLEDKRPPSTQAQEFSQ